MRFNFIVLLTLTGLFAFSQKATIKGVVTDKDMNNETLPFCNVLIKGTKTGTTTDDKGNYTLSVDSGNLDVEFSFLGYETVVVPVVIKAGQTLTLNQVMGSGEGMKLEDVVIKSTVTKESEQALLRDQQKSVEIKQTIGSQEMSKKGLGDVSAAVVKTTGVSKQEGSGNIFVRGLGDRYNSTSINGLPVPSNDPERKNISLELFNTDIVEFIAIDKVYSSRIWGDFAGGNVDIHSKNYKGSGLLEVSLGSSINTNAVNQDNFFLQQGPSKFGSADYIIPNNPLNNFGFTNKLNAETASPFNSKMSLKAGKSFEIGEKGKLNVFANAGFDNGYEYRNGINNTVNAQGVGIKTFNHESFVYKTNTTGMLNANYLINTNNKISYNFLFVNSSSQNKDNFTGNERDYDQFDNSLLIQRNTFVQNTLFINQLLGSHTLSNKITLDWAASYNVISGEMPDRTQTKTGILNTLGSYAFAQNQTPDNHRYFQNLVEDEIAGNLSLTYKFLNKTDDSVNGKLVLGYNGRIKNRDFEAIQFNFRIRQDQLLTAVNPNNLDAFFNTQNYNNGFFSIESFAGETPQTYTGEQNIHAGFANLEYNLSEKLSAILGVRFERIEQIVSWKTQLDFSGSKNTIKRNEFLPSLILKYGLNEKQNLRLGFSKTYTLPQFKERALFIYEDVTEVKQGNPDLYPSQNYNFDLKWELFPKSDEVISATAFGKYIIDPINETLIASSTNDISYLNTGDMGYLYGLELELRKNIFSFDDDNKKLSFGFNAALMKTHQDLDTDKVTEETNYNINLTNTTSGFTGASDFIMNLDMTYNHKFSSKSNIMGTLAYTYNSDKLYTLGVEQKGNLVDKGIGALDFILKTNINKKFGIDFYAKNILNPLFERVQENQGGDITILNFKRGVFVGLGIKYSL